MRENKRSIAARLGTFVRFFRQQRRDRRGIAAGLDQPDKDSQFILTGAEAAWRPAGLIVAKGDRFHVSATGHHVISGALSLAIEARASVFMRIAGGPIRKVADADWIYEAWADGEVEVLSKCLSEFADDSGTLLPGKRTAMAPGAGIRIERTDEAPRNSATPPGWFYLWRLGESRIYSTSGEELRVATCGDVGILQCDVNVPLTPDTRLRWDWLIERLPSRLPEDLAFTHDYLSIAVEFDNGRDLTYMWSAGLPEGHVFRCPLDWWCERETHWVLRSGQSGLGAWHAEQRNVADDYREAMGEAPPARVVRVWLIANSVFQRTAGLARFANIRLGDGN